MQDSTQQKKYGKLEVKIGIYGAMDKKNKIKALSLYFEACDEEKLTFVRACVWKAFDIRFSNEQIEWWSSIFQNITLTP